MEQKNVSRQIVLLEEVQDNAKVELILFFPEKGKGNFRVLLRQTKPMKLPIDSSLGSWTINDGLELSAENPSASEMLKLWNLFTVNSPMVRKDFLQRISEILEETGVLALPTNSNLLR